MARSASTAGASSSSFCFNVSVTIGAPKLTMWSALPPYLAVGAAFGLVFLVTGRLAAAIAAHCAYNALVLAQER